MRMKKVYIYRPHDRYEDCAAVAFDEDGNELGHHISSCLVWAQHDMSDRRKAYLKDVDIEWVVGPEEMEKLIASGAIKNIIRGGV